MRRSTRGAAPVVLVACAALLLVAWPAIAQTSLETSASKEAWFQRALVGGGEDPACSSPAGCPFEAAAPADPYPEDTLHVGAIGGRQESATYLVFPLSGADPDAEVTGGTVHLPVADESSGTSRPDAAAMVACLVTEPFAAAEGGPPEEAPAVDCTTSVDAVYEPDADPARFTVDLIPFVRRWTAGARNHGIGLLVAEGSQETWHAAFSASSREGDDVAPPPTATLTVAEPSSDEGSAPGRPDEPVGGPAGGVDDDTAASMGGTSPPASTGRSSVAGSPQLGREPQPDVAPEGEAPRPQVAQPDEPASATPISQPRVAGGYAYPGVWLLPLALLVGAGSLLRTLRTDVEVLTDADERDLVGRLWLAFFPDGDRGAT